MKTKEILIGLGLGVLIGFGACYLVMGRYTIVHLDNLYVVRLDKITGKTWYSGMGAWKEISEPILLNLPPGFVPEKSN